MKKSHTLLALAIGLTLSSCNSNEPASENTEAPVVEQVNSETPSLEKIEGTIEKIAEDIDVIEKETTTEIQSLEEEAKELDNALNELENL